MEKQSEQVSKSRVGWITIVRTVVALTVVAALAYVLIQSWSQLSQTDFRLSQVNFVYWALAILSYLLAMFLSCLFWYRILKAVGQTPPFAKTLLAFYASQLGKYVPGKAMVVVMRTDIIRGPQVHVGPAAASVFVETLTWIFVGAAIASLLLGFQYREQTSLLVTAVVLTVVAGVLTWPPVFRRIAIRILGSKLDDPAVFQGLNLSTMSFGWLVMTIGWCLNGLSMWLVIRGLPGTDIVPADFPLTLACVSLATVAGFVSLLPGGLGVRELVIIPLLGARFGTVTAVIAAIVIRFVWLVSELISSGIIYLGQKYIAPEK